MRIVKRYLLLLIVFSSLLLVAQPVLADGPGQVAIVGREYTLASGQILDNDLAVVGGKVSLLPGSQVNGSVAVTGGNVVVAGHITGDLVVIGGSLELGATAIVDGDIVTLGSITQATGAIVRGQIINGLGASTNGRSLDRIASIGSLVESGQWVNGIIKLIGLLFIICLVTALATLLAVIWPEKIRTVSVAMRTSWLQCLGAGVLTLLVVVILVPILVIICIGIPVAVVLLIGLAVSGLLGWAAIGKFIGEYVLRSLKIQASTLVQTLAGVLLITLLALIPCLGTLMVVIASSIGIGAVFLTRFGTIGYPRPLPQENGSGAPVAPAGKNPLTSADSGNQRNPEV